MTVIRRLEPGDQAALETFLRLDADANMFLLSNLQFGGLTDQGGLHQATYYGLVAEDAIMGVIAHCWNGIVLPQAAVGMEALAQALVDGRAHRLTGMIGPGEQVARLRLALGLDSYPTRKSDREDLYGLDFARLTPPEPDGTSVRHAHPHEATLLTLWRLQYLAESFAQVIDDQVRAEAAAEIAERQRLGHDFVLVDPWDRPLAYASYNAVTDDRVQIGGVFTPEEFRGKGYARRVVAGAVTAAARTGRGRAVLFTGSANRAARRVYLSLGFEILRDWSLILY